ncbi:hypothetical protein AMJ96_CH01881 [Rhizobium sp. N113]|nr:hypothetical protein AMJ96_CH01881 [Rhizobium sp. N113]
MTRSAEPGRQVASVPLTPQPFFEASMFRFAVLLLVCVSVAGCHTTQFGQSLGWPEPQRTPSAY